MIAVSKSIRLTAVAILTITFGSGQALAGLANHYLEQSAYWLKIAKMSIDTTMAVSSRKDKCIWARQALSEYNKAVEYFDMAVQADRNNPEWSEGDRANAAPFREKLVAQHQRTQNLVKDLC